MSSTSRFSRRAGWVCAVACLAVLAAIVDAGLLPSHAQSPAGGAAASPLQPANGQASQPASGQSGAPASAPAPAPASAPPAALTTAQALSQPANAQAAGDANAAQKPEIAQESAELLKMATALKIEIDKTNQDTLSLAVVRKATEIEQLARKARLGTSK